jgi:hypothetical protein
VLFHGNRSSWVWNIRSWLRATWLVTDNPGPLRENGEGQRLFPGLPSRDGSLARSLTLFLLGPAKPMSPPAAPLTSVVKRLRLVLSVVLVFLDHKITQLFLNIYFSGIRPYPWEARSSWGSRSAQFPNSQEAARSPLEGGL